MRSGSGTVFVVVPGARLDIVTNSSSEVFVTADGRGTEAVRAAILALWEQWKEEHNPGWKDVAAFEADDFAALEVFDGEETLSYDGPKPRTRKRFYTDCATEHGDRMFQRFADKASHPQAVFFRFDSDRVPFDFRERVEMALGGVERLFMG